MRPLAVRIFYIRREHFGANSGISQFIRYLDRAFVSPIVTNVNDGDADMPDWFPLGSKAVRQTLRRVVAHSGQPWYNLSDLAAEVSAVFPWVCGRYDVVHYVDGEHTARYLPAVPRTLRRRGVTVATYHQPPAILRDVVIPAIARRLDHVAVVASAQIEYFARILPPERITVVPHGVDVEFFRRSSPAQRDGPIKCVSVGTYLRDWRLLAQIARLLASRRDIELHVVSDAAPPFETQPDLRVKVYRRIDDAALLALYHRCHIALLPLHGSTANNALMEAMAMRLPVVASDHAAIREYAPAGAAWLVPPQPEAFVDAIVTLAADGDRRESMGAAGRLRAESLAWPEVARAYEKLYRQVAT